MTWIINVESHHQIFKHSKQKQAGRRSSRVRDQVVKQTSIAE